MREKETENQLYKFCLLLYLNISVCFKRKHFEYFFFRGDGFQSDLIRKKNEEGKSDMKWRTGEHKS